MIRLRVPINPWRFLSMSLLILPVFLTARSQDSTANDHMFPAAAAARPFVDFDARGFLINGKRTFLVSAGIEYARLPRAQWYDRLLRLKRAGFNCVEFYTFWNFHETKEGIFDFSGDHDLNYFLHLVKQLGMYAIARVGPYYCAEWDQGGYPLWLRFKPGLRVREPNEPFQRYVGRFFDHLLPIIRKNQVNEGGPVILVQLENEHVLGWGTVMPNAYFRFLQQKALSAGIQVPYFFSGLHHDTDPAGDATNFDDPGRPNPWLSTEFWAVWFNQYGAAAGDADKYERFTRKIIAHGGNGYNYYMAYGGSNFGYTNNDEDAASYDYGAAVGQTGDLRPLYYRMKRCAYFATSFADILENARSGTGSRQVKLNDTSVHRSSRHAPGGTITFLDNPGTTPVRAAYGVSGTDNALPGFTVTLSPGEIFPVVQQNASVGHAGIYWSNTRILGLFRQGTTRTLVCYGEPGDSGQVYFWVKKKTAQGIDLVSFQSRYTASDTPQVKTYAFAGGQVRVLFVSTALADRTWLIPAAGKNYIVCGPAYAGALQETPGGFRLQTETPPGDSVHPVVLLTESKEIFLTGGVAPGAAGDTLRTLSAWQVTDASAPAAPGYNDTSWRYSEQPGQMGMDGDPAPEAWYRTKFVVEKSGDFLLQVKGGDRATCFIDGKRVAAGDMTAGEIKLNLTAGPHLLAVYTAHDGRDKLAGYIGPLDSVNAKGLIGPVWLKADTATAQFITRWRFLATKDAAAVSRPVPPPEAGWAVDTAGQDAFGKKTGYGWFTATIEKPLRTTSRIDLRFKSVDEDATVFVAGIQRGSHRGWNQPFTISVPVSSTTTWPVRLDVFVENHSNEGGIDQPVGINVVGPGDRELTGWRQKGVTGDSAGHSRPLTETQPGGAPARYFSSFQTPATDSAGFHRVWRIVPAGLGHGYVWVNGHNLGHYPEKIAAPGIYIPECWLKPGTNRLEILDEDGRLPVQVSVVAEQAAGRRLQTFFSGAVVISTVNKGHAD